METYKDRFVTLIKRISESNFSQKFQCPRFRLFLRNMLKLQWEHYILQDKYG